jgi:hypothetical protein
MKETTEEKMQSKSSDVWPAEKERRRHKRYSPPVAVELKSKAFNFVLQNISISGFAFLTDENFSNEKNLLVSLGNSEEVQAEVLQQRNLVFDPVFIKNPRIVHCRFMTPILESHITKLLENLTDFNIT